MKYTKNPLIQAWFLIPAYTMFEVIQKGYRQTIEEQDAFNNGIDATIKVAKILTEESK